MMTIHSLEEKKLLRRFEDVYDEVLAYAALNNPDEVVSMADLRITPDIAIEIPKRGKFEMTDWAERQLGSLLGVQWKKWFNPNFVNHKTIQEEVQRRFSKTGMKCKLRTRRIKNRKGGVPDGILRAFLSPTYHPIDDERVFSRLEEQFKRELSEFKFLFVSGQPWHDDRCQCYTIIGEPFDLKEGDSYYPGFRLRNSEVGWAALTVDEFFFRLVCQNGLMVTVGESRLLHRRHSFIEDKVLDQQLNIVFEKIPQLWDKTINLLKHAQSVQINDTEDFIETELKRMNAPQYFRNAVAMQFEANGEEDNLYSIIQSITSAAQEYELERRLNYEAMAGNLLQRAA